MYVVLIHASIYYISKEDCLTRTKKKQKEKNQATRRLLTLLLTAILLAPNEA